MKLTAQIDNLLPQTQCRQCCYDSCLAYAEAIVDGEAIDRCVPGGIKTLHALTNLLERDPEPFLSKMSAQETSPAIVQIREKECIGCTKCIQACPVDAILGAPKQLHTVLTQECTGCALCVEPCPVDCIDILPLSKPTYQPSKARQRFYAKTQRLIKTKHHSTQPLNPTSSEDRLAYVKAAIDRTKKKPKH